MPGARLLSLAVLILMISGSRVVADADTHWQLVFSYNQGGLQLVSSTQIGVIRKTIITPGLESAPIQLGCHAEWFDDLGQPLGGEDFVLPVGIRSAPAQNGTCESVTPDHGVIVVRTLGPASQAAVVRVTRNPERDRVRGLWQIPVGLQFSVRDFQILTPAWRDGPVGFEKVHATGPDDNRLVIVFLGDGFTSDNLAAGRFAGPVVTLIGAFESTDPWGDIFRGTNVYRIDVVSNEEGADNYPIGRLRDTYFNSTFNTSGIDRLLTVDDIGYQRAIAAADAVVGPGVWDEIIILVNSTHYGGSGGAIAVSSLNGYDAVTLHELGHSFANLADEYNELNQTAMQGAIGQPADCGDWAPNIDCDSAGPGLKWLAWVEPGTPLPTPAIWIYSGKIGTFEGANYQAKGIYRPSMYCLMRELGSPFDAVCQESHVLNYLKYVTLTDSILPPQSTTQLVSLAGSEFTVAPIPIGAMEYSWRLNGVPLADAFDSTLHLTTRTLYEIGAGMSGTLQLVMSYPTPRMRLARDTEYYVWTVEADCNGNGIVDYLDISSGRSVDSNSNGIPDECDAAMCCVGTTGNANTIGVVDLSDLSLVIAYLTYSQPPDLPCPAEANVNGTGIVDLSDLSLLIAYLTSTPRPTLPDCL